MQGLSSPKRKTDKSVRTSWYPYHAGYSESFVEDILRHLKLRQGATVLDPWNGTGTTTSVAYQNDYEVKGFDINPALVIIAKARVLHSDVVDSLPSIADDIIAKVKKLEHKQGAGFEALEMWFAPDSAALIRRLEQQIYHLLISADCYTYLFHSRSLNAVSSLAAFFYVALFKTVRDFVEPDFKSNPVWIKQAKDEGAKLRPKKQSILKKFKENVSTLSSYVRDNGLERARHNFELDFGNAENLPLKDDAVDAIITSPPYCTRIDYAIATLPEIAVLGFKDKKALKQLRDKITGTPTIAKQPKSYLDAWGKTCLTFLELVEHHQTTAARHYYLKFYAQYFASLYKSMTEMDRVLKKNATCVVVIQDSYFKDLHADLPSMSAEMAQGLGMQLISEIPFSVRHNLADANVSSKKYRASSAATEVVQIFQK